MGLLRTLLFALLLGNVFLRVLTNSLTVLPRAFNLWDLILTVAIVLTSCACPRARVRFQTRPIWTALVLFNLLIAPAWLLNMQHIHPVAALSQWAMWNEPIWLFLALVNADFTAQDAVRFHRVLLTTVWIQVAIGLLQIPRAMSSGESELIIGTFIGNAEQYQFFILYGVYILWGMRLARIGRPMLALLATLGLLALILLIDNKASWVMLGLTLLLLARDLGMSLFRNRSTMRVLLPVSAVLALGIVFVRSTSGTLSKFDRIATAWHSGNVRNLGKIKAVRDVMKAYWAYPHMLFVGAGPGTFYSRAASEFFPLSISSMFSGGSIDPSLANNSASMAGIITRDQDFNAFYKQYFDREKIYALGSGTSDLPRSSYLALASENGLLGLALYSFIYLRVIRHLRASLKLEAGNHQGLLIVLVALGGLIYLLSISTYNFWLETGRVTTICWAAIAMAIRYTLSPQAVHSSQRISPGRVGRPQLQP